MDFSEFCNSIVDPLYEVKGGEPVCPKGFTYDKKIKQCVPSSNKENPGDPPHQGPTYDVFGQTGLNGDGYAWGDDSDSKLRGDVSWEGLVLFWPRNLQLMQKQRRWA